MKKIVIGVSDFGVPVPLRGSIDSFSGLGRSAQIGTEIHQRVQALRATEFPNYKAEVFVSHEFVSEGYTFEVSGRMDGFFEEGEYSKKTKIEEIKSSFNAYELFRRLKGTEDHPYLLQLKTYGYFYYLKNKKIPDLNLHIVSSRNEDSINLSVELDLDFYEAWLEKRLAELVQDAKAAEKRAKRRKKAAGELSFPFTNAREGQFQLMETVEKTMAETKPMMIQAPTGLGKTIGVLYPSLKEALGRGQRVVYITPKNSQQSVAQDAVERLQEAGANIKALTITAKSKICFKNEPICNPDYCEYAKDHYTKMAENKTLEKLAKKKNLTARTFRKIAEEHQVCPFEIQLDSAIEADTVICDYNYVFAPRSSFGRLASSDFEQTGKPNLVIDEAHNLPSRAMDYYSPTLSTKSLENMREDISRLPLKFQAEAKKLLNDCIDVIKECGPKDCSKPCRIDPPVGVFMAQDDELRSFLSAYLKSDVEIEAGDVVLRLSFYWSEFTHALEFVSSGRKEFFTTFSPYPPSIRITCCDASEMLKDCYKEYEQILAFSATLKPFNYYSQLAGLQSANLRTAEFSSPFPRSNRKVLIIPQISSKYSERERNYPRIADAIQKISAIKKGNYFAFFPSFEFMERTLAHFTPPEDFLVMKQERYMKKMEIETVLERLKVEHTHHIVFAVQGGVFSEGVDYPGRMLIGAFVVGPPLPTFDLEREKMREYYEENYSSGFDYAYTFPAMSKAVQAAGRVIRSEEDRGLIVLMDNRFTQPSYCKSMPADWYDEDPRELVSARILEDVSAFWNG